MGDLPPWLQRASMDQAPVGITIADARREDNPIIYVNDRFVDLTGYPREEVFGENCRFLQGPETDEATVDRIREALDAEEPVSVVIRNYRKDGTPFWNQLDISPVWTDGEVTHYFGFQKDVTERVELRRELERRNERLDEFVEDVSHDLRNPLNVAQGRLALAREADDGTELAQVEEAIDRMVELVDDLLALSRDQSSMADCESVDLATAAEDAWALVATGDASLDVATDESVAANRSRLLTLLENLFRNAVEHGGDDVRVVVGDLDGGFFVADDGPGIPADDRDAVLESGYSTTTDGTGLGLDIVETVVDAHGWTLTVTEGAAGGARFEITDVDRPRS